MREADIIDASDDVELRRAVHAGIEDLDHGRCEPWDPQAIKTNGRRLMEEHASRKP